jgi:hypothetical protein
MDVLLGVMMIMEGVCVEGETTKTCVPCIKKLERGLLKNCRGDDPRYAKGMPNQMV